MVGDREEELAVNRPTEPLRARRGFRRKTAAEKRQERATLEQKAWELFRKRLEAVDSFVDAQQLAFDRDIRPYSPGRRYYSNLAFLLNYFHPPADSNNTEKALYIQLIQRLDDANQLKPGLGKQVQSALRKAMES